MKNSVDTIENGTRDLPAYTLVSSLTKLQIGGRRIIDFLLYTVQALLHLTVLPGICVKGTLTIGKASGE